jgi:hypothetical protein
MFPITAQDVAKVQAAAEQELAERGAAAAQRAPAGATSADDSGKPEGVSWCFDMSRVCPMCVSADTAGVCVCVCVGVWCVCVCVCVARVCLRAAGSASGSITG